MRVSVPASTRSITGSGWGATLLASSGMTSTLIRAGAWFCFASETRYGMLVTPAGLPAGTVTRTRSPSIQARSLNGLSPSDSRLSFMPVGEESFSSGVTVAVVPARTRIESFRAFGNCEPPEVGTTTIQPVTMEDPSEIVYGNWTGPSSGRRAEIAITWRRSMTTSSESGAS